MTKRSLTRIAVGLGLSLVAAPAAADFPTFPLRRCAIDAVIAGTVCLDRYEASVWRVPEAITTNAALVRKIQLGVATRADLTAGGATRLGVAGDDYAPCPDDGQDCDDLYAVSLPAEIPSTDITWFQAQEACAHSGKRLPTNAEWQVGANGTPDPATDDGATTCNIDGSAGISPAGARSACVSSRGAFDMVGNAAEWVAEWVPVSTTCPGWSGFSDDEMCLAGASTTRNGPAALVRGGAFAGFGGTSAGPLSVRATFEPNHSTNLIGFRCAR